MDRKWQKSHPVEVLFRVTKGLPGSCGKVSGSPFSFSLRNSQWHTVGKRLDSCQYSVSPRDGRETLNRKKLT